MGSGRVCSEVIQYVIKYVSYGEVVSEQHGECSSWKMLGKEIFEARTIYIYIYIHANVDFLF